MCSFIDIQYNEEKIFKNGKIKLEKKMETVFLDDLHEAHVRYLNCLNQRKSAELELYKSYIGVMYPVIKIPNYDEIDADKLTTKELHDMADQELERKNIIGNSMRSPGFGDPFITNPHNE